MTKLLWDNLPSVSLENFVLGNAIFMISMLDCLFVVEHKFVLVMSSPFFFSLNTLSDV